MSAFHIDPGKVIPTEAELSALETDPKYQQLLAGLKEVSIDVIGVVDVCPYCGVMVGIEECTCRN